MDSNELLNRIKEKDREAFLQLMQTYGKKLYSRLLSQLGDKTMTDAAFKETMVGFYNTLTGIDSEDAVEALLFGYADQTRQQMFDSSLDRVIDDTLSETTGAEKPKIAPPAAVDKAADKPAEKAVDKAAEKAVEISHDTVDSIDAVEPGMPEIYGETEESEAAEGCISSEEKRHGGFIFWLCLTLLSLGIIAALWVMAGLMMDMNIIPKLDLGYTWFSANVAPWF